MKRKHIAAILACTLLSAPGIYGNVESQQLEIVIKTVKEKVMIPEDYSQFEYSENNGIYYLSWRSLDNSGWVNVGCEQDGDVLDYYYWDENRDESGIANVSYSEAVKYAEAFLKQAVPEYAAALEKAPQAQPDHDSNYCIKFNLTHEGITVYDYSATVEVNKYTGVISSFSGFEYDEKAKYTTPTPTLSKEEADKAYVKQIGLPLVYSTYWAENNVSQAFLIYNIDNREDKGIDAIKGNVVKQYQKQEISIYDKGGTGDATNAASLTDSVPETVGLTPEEQTSVDTTKGLLSAEALKEKVTTYFPILKEMSVIQSNTYSSEGKYTRQVRCVLKLNEKELAGAFFRCDAKTGELISYSYYSDEQDRKMQQEPWSSTQALSLIQKASPSIAKEIDLSKEENNEESQTQSFYFDRLYDKIPVSGDGISIQYDQSLGQVTDYYVNWSENMNLPSSKGVLSKEAVMKQAGLRLYYMETQAHQYSLVYAFEERFVRLDAFTGNKVNSRGEIIRDSQVSFYTDISGHPKEDIITKLYNSGIYLEGPTLNPNAAITQEEMLRLIEQAMYLYENSDNVYETAISLGIIKEDEKKLDKKLTKEEGIRYLINATPYKKLAQLTSIYKYPFDESQVDESMKGYISIAYGLNWLGDIKSFNPNETLTKADAMVMIYALLQEQ